MNSGKNQKLLLQDLSNCIRILAADAIEAAKSGHPGLPLGMADVMTVLATEFLKFRTDEPKWFNRDRLVLSAGHGSMLLYAFYYLTGFAGFSLDDIKNFRSLHSIAAGHPEHELYEAIETTTGPLGQGFASSVGVAIAGKKYQARLGKDLASFKVYCIVSDGCLMEGIAYEAASLAGHLRLDNLIVIFDDNGISIDGRTDLAISEDQLAKFAALGFEVERIDGHDFEQIREALARANKATRPYFIACKTTIGKGSNLKAGSEKAHGSPLGRDEIQYLKSNNSFSLEPFAIPENLLNYWRKTSERNDEAFKKWQESFAALDDADRRYITSTRVTFNEINIDVGTNTGKPEATRVSSGKILQEILKSSDKIICGSADLSLSNNVFGENSKAIRAEDFSGNFIHYGIREHAMGGIMNGLALSGFLPVGATFLVFSDYMRPAIRLAAIMKISVIYIMTHDSIGVGEDGPTHQPIEHLASFRAMPNIKVFRPADFIETIECYNRALLWEGPSMLVLSRQNLCPVRDYYDKGDNLCARGGYVIASGHRERGNPQNTDVAQNTDVVIFASGSEVQVGIEAKSILENEYHKTVRLISLPCFEELEEQGEEYFQKLVDGAALRVGIEAGSGFGWHKITGDQGLFFGVDRFGLSAPADVLYDYFGLNAKIIAGKIIAKLSGR